jgi:hypothetical protein
LISGTHTLSLSIFINSLIVLSVIEFVFASITLWYMFAHKFHGWEERREEEKRDVFFDDRSAPL